MDVDRTTVDIVKESNNDDIVTLTTGVRVKLVPVNLLLLQNVLATVEAPKVPIVHDDDKGRDIKNPNDPDYLNAIKKADNKRGMLVYDFLTLSGIELVDGIPNDGKWEKKLKLLVRAGLLNLSEFDLEDEIDREYLYKRFVAVGTEDFKLLNSKYMISGAKVDQKKDNFRSKT